MMASGTTSASPGPLGTGSGKPTRMAPREATARTWRPITLSSHRACWCWARSRYRPWGQGKGGQLQGEEPQNQRLGRRKENEGVGREGREAAGSKVGGSWRGEWCPLEVAEGSKRCSSLGRVPALSGHFQERQAGAGSGLKALHNFLNNCSNALWRRKTKCAFSDA